MVLCTEILRFWFAMFFRFADILLSVDIAVPGRTGTVCSQGVAYHQQGRTNA